MRPRGVFHHPTAPTQPPGCPRERATTCRPALPSRARSTRDPRSWSASRGSLERGGCSPRPRTNARHLFYCRWYVAASGTAQQAPWAAVARARAAGTAAGASRSRRPAGWPGCWLPTTGAGLGTVSVQFVAAGGLLWPAGRPTWRAEACRRRAARLRQKSRTGLSSASRPLLLTIDRLLAIELSRSEVICWQHRCVASVHVRPQG